MSNPQQPVPFSQEYLLKCSIVALVNNATGNQEKRHFEAVFTVDQKGANMPWYVLHNYLAPKFLNQKLGPQGQGWVRIYEAKTLKLINRNDPTDISMIPLRVMTHEQLASYISRWELPMKVEDFHDLPTAIQFVKLYQDDPTGYQVQFDSYVAGKGRKYPELDHFRKSHTATSSQELEDEFDRLEKVARSAPVQQPPADPFNVQTQPTAPQAPVSTVAPQAPAEPPAQPAAPVAPQEPAFPQGSGQAPQTGQHPATSGGDLGPAPVEHQTQAPVAPQAHEEQTVPGQEPAGGQPATQSDPFAGV